MVTAVDTALRGPAPEGTGPYPFAADVEWRDFPRVLIKMWATLAPAARGETHAGPVSGPITMSDKETGPASVSAHEARGRRRPSNRW